MKLISGLKIPIIDLDGKPIKDSDDEPLVAHKLIANSLAGGKSGEPGRAVALSQKFYDAGDTLELDHSDLNFAQKAVKANPLFSDWSIDHITRLLESAVDVKVDKKEEKKPEEKPPEAGPTEKKE